MCQSGLGDVDTKCQVDQFSFAGVVQPVLVGELSEPLTDAISVDRQFRVLVELFAERSDRDA
jgi:hypothetical protein